MTKSRTFCYGSIDTAGVTNFQQNGRQNIAKRHRGCSGHSGRNIGNAIMNDAMLFVNRILQGTTFGSFKTSALIHA